ncbi:MAG: type IX secretion system membrane protein PorP/SprF [Bacteroidia bacterium]
MKITKIITVLGLLLFPAVRISAQQDPMYTMYMFDKMLINPGYTGSSNWAVGTLKYREQFVGFDGRPVTGTFNFHAPVPKKHIGLGFKVISDKAAVMSNLNASFYYAYHLNFAGGKLSLGLEAGVYDRRMDFAKLILSTPGDHSVPIEAVSSTVPDASLGLYYQKKQFYLGLSDCHLLKRNFNYHTLNESESHLYNHYYLLGGTVLDLSDKIAFEPSFLVKYQPAAPVQLDVNGLLSFYDRIAVGVHYRTGDAAAAMIKINILENLRVAYSYDMTISGLSGYSHGAHEIIISYGIRIPPPPAEKEVHPRYYY